MNKHIRARFICKNLNCSSAFFDRKVGLTQIIKFAKVKNWFCLGSRSTEKITFIMDHENLYSYSQLSPEWYREKDQFISSELK